MTTQAAAPPKKGPNRGNAGKGRPKGALNKTTRELKEMMLDALVEVGGTAYLVRQATERPVAFMAMLGKVLPLQVNGSLDHTGGITVNIKQF